MAIHKDSIVDVDLTSGTIHRSFLNHSIGMNDSDGDFFGVRVFKGGEPVDLTNVSVQGHFNPPVGAPIFLNAGNYISGNVATVRLPQACYNYEGPFSLAIKLVTVNETVTVRIVDGMVDNTYVEGSVAPTGTVPTYQEVLAEYDQMVAATATANAAAQTAVNTANTAATTAVNTANAAAANCAAIVAAPYSNSATYAVGSYCTKDGKLYECTTAITTAEEWTAGHWTETKVGPEVSDLKSAFELSKESTATDIEQITNNRIGVFDYGYYKTVEVGGTVEFISSSNYVSTLIPVTEGDIITLDAYGWTQNSRLYVFIDANGKALNRCNEGLNGKRTIEAPANAVYCAINNRLASKASGYYAYKGEAIVSAVDDLRHDYEQTHDAMDRITGTENYVFEYNYYHTTPSVGSAVSKLTSSNFATVKIPVVAGDAIRLNATGTNSNSRLYVFIDQYGNAMNQCDTNLSGDRTIYVPEGAVYCAINNRHKTQESGFFAYKQNNTGYLQANVIVPKFKTGKINTDGSPGTDVTKIRSLGYLNLGKRIKIDIPDGYKISIFVYTEPHNEGLMFISDYYTETLTLDVYEDLLYRFMISATDDSDISGSVAEIANSFIFTNYIEPVDDTVLFSTNDDTDRTDDIEKAINSGYAKLGPGIFYTTGITMPDDSKLEGSGMNTILYLTGNDDEAGNAITLGSRCIVKDIQIKGRPVDYVFEGEDNVPSVPGERHGIYLGSGNEKGYIENCYIHGFSGGAITAYQTGFGSSSGLLINNCYLILNSVGVYFIERTEFHIVQNCTIQTNYYGVINQGANNTFVGCNISTTYYGFYHNFADRPETIDHLPNNMHGLIANCEFKHIRTRAIYINRTGSSFLCTGCQFGSSPSQPGGIELIRAQLMRFTGCVASDNFPFYITNGGLTVFSDWSFFKPLGECIITNNDKVKFVNCYDSAGNIVDPTQA